MTILESRKAGLSMKAKSLLSGILIGTVVAAAATLLTTPITGAELQTKCKTNARKIRMGVRQFSNDSKALTKQIKQTTEISKSVIKVASTEMNQSIRHFKEDIMPALNHLKEEVDALQKNIEQTRKLSD
ncbi:hypothetical protein GN156_12125 [bacterium LRH843]|nr:hypothetical protein [bacterium LRH843]